MTDYRCWVTYKNDKALQSKVRRGVFGKSLPLDGFPAPSQGGWPGLLVQWCKKREIQFVDEGLTVRAKVKRDQIIDFIEFVYADDRSYNDPAKMLTWEGKAYLANSLTNLRAFAAQKLNPRLWYELVADEW